MENRNLYLAWGSVMLIFLISIIFFTQARKCNCEQISAAPALDSAAYYRQQALVLQDTIFKIKSEKTALYEKNALLINANLSLSGRIRAINEYIRTGRLPSDSNIR